MGSDSNHHQAEVELESQIHPDDSTSPYVHKSDEESSSDPAVAPRIQTGQQQPASATGGAPRDWRFWAILSALCITSLLTAIESTVTSTALPTIVRDLGSQEQYVWFANALFLTSTAVQPLFGQLANIFGRRWPTITAVAIFALGSGVSGGATSTAMLIGGRAVQGIGLGGVNMMIDIVVCDLVPLRERGNFMGIIFAVFSVGSSLGPFIGGVLVQRVSWRWVFYISLPVAGAALVLMVLFLQVAYTKESSFGQKIRRIDFIGNAILMSSVIAILIALTYAGTIRAWSSWRSILPLVLGFTGLAVFHLFEATKYCVEPIMPPRLFSNRTSLIGFTLSFLHGALTYWVVYFLPVYFQSVLRSSPTRSGVQLLPTVIVLIPFAIIAGVMVTQTGRYKPIQVVGFTLMTLGVGLFTLLDASTPTGQWVGFQILVAAGSGLVVTSILPAIQAELPESDVASSTATWAFVRSFGSIWGVSIPAAIFNNQFDKTLGGVSDSVARERLQGGNAYAQASSAFINSFPVGLRSQIINTYAGALKQVWQVAIAFAALGFILVWFEREVQLRKTLDTEYGMKDRKRTEGSSVAQVEPSSNHVEGPKEAVAPSAP